MSCGVGCRHGSDLALLWLWCSLAATAPMGPLAWEPPYAAGVALKRTKDQKKKKKKKAAAAGKRKGRGGWAWHHETEFKSQMGYLGLATKLETFLTELLRE